MFSLTIAFGETPAMWRLSFKTAERAEAAWNVAIGVGEVAIIEDDFGQRCCVLTKDILGTMLEDLEQSRLAGVEMMLHNARTQALAQTQARQEPTLRNAGQGPSVFVPNGGGRMS